MTLILGVDVSTSRVAFADTDGGTHSLMLMKAAEKEGSGDVLADTFHRCSIAARQFANGRPVMAVFYEVPMGQHPKPFLMQTVGAAAGGISAGLETSQAHPVSVWPINIQTWKRLSVGFGNASKSQVLKWASDLGYAGRCPKCDDGTARDCCKHPCEAHDEADAKGIAVGGARWLAEAGRQEAA